MISILQIGRLRSRVVVTPITLIKKNIKSKNFFKKKENKIVLYLHFPASACPLSYFDI